MWPYAAPVQPNATPMHPNAGPVQPNAAPVQPNPAPVLPNGAPMQPNGAPMQPNGAPMQPNPIPVGPQKVSLDLPQEPKCCNKESMDPEVAPKGIQSETKWATKGPKMHQTGHKGAPNRLQCRQLCSWGPAAEA